jgi:small redox-active disulfide protein 2
MGRISKMTIKVLGACCKRSLSTFENVKKAVAALGLGVEVENVGDVEEIARYGVLSTPALVIDEKVVSFGRLLEVKDAIKIIEKVTK